MRDRFEFLKHIEFFKALSDDEIQLLNQACVLESYEADQVVIREGDLKEKFYIILEGSVSIVKGQQHHGQSTLADLQQGDLFGELSFIDDHPRSATVRTTQKSRLLTIQKEDFMTLLAESAAISFAIMKWMAAMIRKFNRHYVNAMHARNVALEAANRRLKTEIEVRKDKEWQLNEHQEKLEERVRARTKELRESNQKLQNEIGFRRKTEAEKEKAIVNLESTLDQIKTLSGLFPVCIKCRKIRDDSGYWHQLEQYLVKYSEAEFRESICGECSQKYYAQFYE
jgi:CRP-like cAMP-binding protein